MDNLNNVVERVESLYGLILHPVQIKAIESMYKGNIINMETGEGKTIVIIVTAVLKALKGEQVTVITPNDYLNERDSNMCKELAKQFKLKVTMNGTDNNKDERTKREIYKSNIIYSTCSEFVFDYLRGKGMGNFNEILLRNSIIIDEIDQVLIDNSNTDYTISFGEGKPIEDYELRLYTIFNSLSKTLIGGEITLSTLGFDIEENDELDFVFNKLEGFIYLTIKGENRVKSILNLDGNLPMEIEVLSALLNTLNAQFMLDKGVDYVVRKGKLSIIDKNNGRYKPNNQYSSGVNLALEIKEDIDISYVTQGEESINGLFFFSQFKDLVGCSGTAWECKSIFEDILNTTVRKIKRNKPKNVTLEEPMYFATKEDKYKEAITLITRLNQQNLPLLIISENDNDSKEFYHILEDKFEYVLELNNNTLENETEIIKKSGMRNSILLSTLISGRGTDIKINNLIDRIGGLQVIFLSRFGNVRAEKQVIGRTGRQGERGTIFFLSSIDDSVWSSANIKEKENLIKYVEEKRTKKINKMLFKLQEQYKNRINQNIKNLYKVNSIKNIMNNYISSRETYTQELKDNVDEYIKGYNLSTDKEYYSCILDLKVYVDKILRRGNRNEYHVKSSM